MARISDWFTNGGYSKALDERNRLADASLGASGYTRAQTEAMRFARDLAKSHNAQLQGNTMSENTPLGQRLAMSSQVQPQSPDMANVFHGLDTAGVTASENRVAQQQANAMNKQARLGQALESGANAIDAGLKAGMMNAQKKPATNQAIMF